MLRGSRLASSQETGHPEPAARARIPGPRQAATANLAQLQSEIQGSYDTHVGQIVCISFSSGTVLEFRGLKSDGTLGTEKPVRDAAGAIRIVLYVSIF